jgi:hypothetical protein
MTHRVIELVGYSNKNNVTLWCDGHIYECTSFDAADFDYGDAAEDQLQHCNNFIQHMEASGEWLPGIVTAYISEY